MATTTDAAKLYKAIQILADHVGREAPLTQVLAYLKIGARDEVDQGRLMEELGLSSAGSSRTIQALSNVHYAKNRPGYGLVERQLDPMDLRRRVLTLTPEGKKLLTKMGAALK